jgi:hypothetical protein
VDFAQGVLDRVNEFTSGKTNERKNAIETLPLAKNQS